MRKQFGQLEQVLKDNGMELRPNGSGHLSVTKNGKHITTVSATPSDPHFVRQTIRVLVRTGHLPESCRRIKG